MGEAVEPLANARKNLWVLEDDPGVQFVYEEILGLRYELKMIDTVSEFQSLLANRSISKPDLIIVDLRLRDTTFLSYLMSEQGSELPYPFLVVSSVDDVDALRVCYDGGCLDYITKPFGKGELVVKVERILTNGGTSTKSKTKIAVDAASLTVSHDGVKSPLLTSKEFQIVSLLERASNHTISREEIITQIWGLTKVTSKTFDVHLVNLRKKLASIGLDIRFMAPSTYRLLRNRVDSQAPR